MKITVKSDGSIWHDNWVERRSPLRVNTNGHTPWRASWCTDPDAKVLADRHYNRQKPDSKRFMPPARSLVLLTDNQSAVWGTSYLFAEYVRHAWAGAFVNSLFRNEGQYLSSDLIRMAVAHTIWTWPETPDLGMITFVDAGQVRPKRDPGRCYLRAGFKHVGFTKGGLYAFQLLPHEMPEPEPVIVRCETHGDVESLREVVQRAWDGSTSAAVGWTSTNPSMGQCAVTALVVQNHLGGILLRAVNEGVSHYWNLLSDGREIDLTREQFAAWNPGETTRRDREYVLSFPETVARYERLLARMS